MMDLFSGVQEARLLFLLITVGLFIRYAITWHTNMRYVRLRLAQLEEEVRHFPEQRSINQQSVETTSPREYRPIGKPDSIELVRQCAQRHYPTRTKNIAHHSSEPLSSYDELLCMLIRLEYTNKEIASILSITSNSVVTARYRLRRKLGLDQRQQLDNWIQEKGQK